MKRRYGQVEMTRVYGIFHYLTLTIYDACFRGEVAGLENIPGDEAFIIASNHASHLDPPIVGAQVSRQMAFFARRTLWNSPIARWWLDTVGTIPVDRDGASDVGAIRNVLRTLQSGKGLILFPEGTRSPDGRLQSAKPGVGLIACRSGVPVVPVRIFDSNLAFGRHGRLRPGTPVSIVFGRPLSPADYDRPEDGKDRYQRASERIMAAIARLERPQPTVI